VAGGPQVPKEYRQDGRQEGGGTLEQFRQALRRWLGGAFLMQIIQSPQYLLDG
jgi:hypothetical protein